jgi:DNA polymerase-3 subunit alpha
MGKKKPDEMARQLERFVNGATGRGVPREKAERLFALIEKFAGYGFPKAHSTAYALITYQTAWLMANHPREYLASLLSVESGNHDKLARYIAHARARGIEVLPPDVNESDRDFSVAPGGIRFGLAGVKNVGEGAIEAVTEERRSGGRFRGFFELCERVDPRRVNRRVVESQVKCGAFDSLHPNRAALAGALDTALERGAAAHRDRELGQSSLFGDVAAGPASAGELPDTPPWTERERLGHEKDVLGFYVTGHPLQAHAAALRRFADVTAGGVEGRAGREVRAGGLLTTLRETRTRRGDLMAFGTLEDLEGAFELVLFSEPYGRLRELLKRAAAGDGEGGPLALLVSGTLEGVDPPKLLVRDAVSLADAEEKLAAQLRITIVASEATQDRLRGLRRVLDAHRGDCGVLVHLRIPGESETVLALSDDRGVEPSDELLHEIQGLFGRPVADLVL